MHYIVGTTIQVTQKTLPKIQPGMTSAQIRASSTKSTRFSEQRSLFDNNEYTLTRIYKQDDKVAYQFSSKTGSRVVPVFDSVKQAESFIAELRNEIVPDYSNVYIDMTD